MMRRIGELLFRLRAFFLRSAMERDLLEEIEDHISREAAKYEGAGMDPAEALRAARVRFGGEERFREQAREEWGFGLVTDLGMDLRYASRQLRTNPAFSVLAVLTLALGIGGTVALSSVVWGLLLRPLPIVDEANVVTWWSPYNWRGAEFDYIRDVPLSFEGLAAFSNDGYTLKSERGSSIVLAAVSSAELFDVLGARPLLGRTFLPGEDRPGAEPVVVLGHAIWAQEFGADPSIVGRRINLSGAMRTVIGVMPEGFYFPTPESDLFVPLDLDPADPAYGGNGWLILIGRLRPGMNEELLAADLERITTALDAEYDYPAAWDKTRDARFVPIRDYLVGDLRPALLVLLGAVGMVLLMACVNVAALLLTKTVDRAREVAVRAALGAGRARLARQVLTESLVLGVISGAAGIGLAVGLFDLIVASLPVDPGFRETLSLDWTALVTTLVLAIGAGSAVALAPIRNLLAGDVAGAGLTDRTAGAGAAHAGRLQHSLVVAEVLLAVVLVTGASLLVRTVDRLRSVDVGFDPAGVLALDLLLAEEETSEAERAAFFDVFLERANRLPGVASVALTNRLPLRDGGYQGTVGVDGRPDLEGINRPNALYRPVTPAAFETLGISLVEGRGINSEDRAGTPSVAVINETFARTAWGGEGVLGRTFTSGFVDGPVTVVGVVRDLAVTDLVGPPPMTAYYAWDQTSRGTPYTVVVARASAGDPAALAGPLRTLARELDADAAVARVVSMADVVDAEMAEALRLRFFLGLFSLLGIVLGSVGVYGVVSYSVQRRRPEFGIRLALGADPGRLRTAVLARALTPVFTGILGGTLVTLFASRLLGRFLYEVSPVDPISIVAAAGILLIAGVTAAAVPAIRASLIRPAVALRAE